MTEKDYSGYLIINWRDGRMRLRVSTPSLEPYEIAVKYKLKVRVPDLEIPVIDIGVIEIPEVKVEATEFETVPIEEE